MLVLNLWDLRADRDFSAEVCGLVPGGDRVGFLIAAEFTELAPGGRMLSSGVGVVPPGEQPRRLGSMADLSQDPCGSGRVVRGGSSVFPRQHDLRALLKPSVVRPGALSPVVGSGEDGAEGCLLEISTLWV